MRKFLTKLARPVFVVSFIVLLFVGLFVFKGVFGNLIYNDVITTIDRRLTDYILKYRGAQPVSGKVALVAVDGPSVKELGRWPWSRNLITQAIDVLNNYYKVKVIGFDIVFSEPDQTYQAVQQSIEKIPNSVLSPARKEMILKDRNYDAQLASRFDNYDNIVSGYFFRNDLSEGGVSKKQLDDRMNALSPMKIGTIIYNNNKPLDNLIHSADFPEINIFASQLKKNRSAGFFSITPDPDDGVVRRVESIFKLKDSYYPSLALTILQKYKQIESKGGYNQFSVTFDENGFLSFVAVGDDKYAVDPEGTFRINFRGPQGTIKHFSFVDVLNKKYPQDELKDKLVFIGVTELGVYDIRSTPVSGEFPGLEVQGTILENLISNNFLTQNNYTQLLSIIEIILVCILLLIVKKYFSGLLGDLGIIVIAALLIWYNIYLFNHNNYLVSLSYPILALFLSWLYSVLYISITEGRDKRFIKGAFGQYLAPKVIDQLIHDPSQLKLGGHRKELTIMFTDLQGFSSISEKFDVIQITSLLNEYLTKMVNIIMKYEGTVDKFEGDAIIAFWGAPIDTDKHQLLACQAVVEMQNEMVEFRKFLASKNYPAFIMRVGVNSGEVMVGNFGSQQRMDYTVIGDAANLAARLEGVNKVYGTQTMISESTYKAVADKFEARMLDEVLVVGKDHPIKVYELLALKGGLTSNQKILVENYSKALDLYRNRNFEGAEKIFKQLETKLADKASVSFLNRIAEFKENPPDKSWNGAYRLTSK